MAIGTQIREHDRHWAWKFVFRLALSISCIITIGMLAYLNAPSTASYSDSTGLTSTAWTFIPLGLSVVWSCVSIPILFARKRPVHPGFNVAFDLILSLGLGIAAGIVTTLAVLNMSQVSDDSGSYFDDYSYYGYGSPVAGGAGYSGPPGYSIYNDINNSRPYVYTTTTGQSQTRTPSSADYQCPAYDTCADQNAAAVKLSYVYRVMLAAGVFLCIATILQFILFVWACVDCHAYNRSAVYDHRARDIAEKMIADMRIRGELPPVASTAYEQHTQHTQQAVPLMQGAPMPSPMFNPGYTTYRSNEITPVGSPRPDVPAMSSGAGYHAVQQRPSSDQIPDERTQVPSMSPAISRPASSKGKQPQMQQTHTTYYGGNNYL